MNKPQAVALLELIADLYRLANEPEPTPEVVVGDVADAAPLAGFSDKETCRREVRQR